MDPSDSPASQPGASPVKAFLIILALIILTTIIFLVAANGEGSPDANKPASNPPPDFSLTDEEAIARFEDLYAASNEIYQTLDVTLIPSVYAQDSAIYRKVKREIGQLRKDGVRAVTEAETESIDIVSNDPDEIVVRQVVVVDIVFLDQDDVDVTEGGGREKQTIEWHLVPSESRWVIEAGTIVAAQRVQ